MALLTVCPTAIGTQALISSNPFHPYTAGGANPTTNLGPTHTTVSGGVWDYFLAGWATLPPTGLIATPTPPWTTDRVRSTQVDDWCKNFCTGTPTVACTNLQSTLQTVPHAYSRCMIGGILDGYANPNLLGGAAPLGGWTCTCVTAIDVTAPAGRCVFDIP
jgi:hypothetical protein